MDRTNLKTNILGTFFVSRAGAGHWFSNETNTEQDPVIMYGACIF